MKTNIMLVLFIVLFICVWAISNEYYIACIAFMVGGALCVVKLDSVDGKQQKKQEELQTRKQLKM